MKRKITYIILVMSGLFIYLSFNAQKNGALNNSTLERVTGAPGDIGTCYYCHVDHKDNTGAGILTLDFDSSTYWYEPGKTYKIDVSITNQTSSRYGFQATSLTSNGNSMAGKFLPATGTDTFYLNVGSGKYRRYIEQDIVSSSGKWNFMWEAPSSNAGEIIFYTAGVVGMGNTSTQGDYPYATQVTVKPLVSPVASFNTTQTTACVGDTIKLTSTSTAAFTHDWTISAGTPSSLKDSVVLLILDKPGSIDVKLKITNSLGADSITKQNHISVNAIPPVSVMTSPISCNNADDGCIAAQVSGAHTYSWSNGSDSSSICNLQPGKYCVTVTSSMTGCAFDTCVTIANPSPINTDYVVSDLTCFESNDGKINSSVSGGVPPYTYNWSNGSFTPPLSGLSAGTYSLTVTDANGCSVTENVTVNQPPEIILDTALQHSTTGSNGSIDLTVTGGTPPYEYSWSNGAWTQDLNFLSGGVYCVTVTDDNDCVDSLCAWVSFPEGIEQGNMRAFKLYPNPARDQIQISLPEQPEPEVVFLLDPGGNILKKIYPASANFSIDVSDLPNGLYLIYYSNTTDRYLRKFEIID